MSGGKQGRMRVSRRNVGYGAAIVAALMIGIISAAWLWGTKRFYTDADRIRQPVAMEPPRDVLWEPPTPFLTQPAVESASQDDPLAQSSAPGDASSVGSAPVDSTTASADSTAGFIEDLYEPALSLDGGLLFYVTGRAGDNAEIVMCERQGEGWSAPRPLIGVNGPEDDLGPFLAPEGNALYFYSNRPGGHGGFDLWMARRNGSEWETPFNLGTRVNSAFNEYNPALRSDGHRLLFASNRPREGEESDAPPPDAWPATVREQSVPRWDYDVYASDWTPQGWDAPAPLPSLNSPSHEGTPRFSPAGDFIYFASDRPDGGGGFDLYRSRVVHAQIWAPENLGPAVNTPLNELDPALGSAGFELLFSSDRPASSDQGAARTSYRLFQTFSREVFEERVAADYNLAAWWSLIGWNLLWLLLALLLALPLLRAMKAAKAKQIPLFIRCLLASLFAHLLLVMLFQVWQVTTRLAESVGHRGPIQIAFGPQAGMGEIVTQIRGEITDSLAPPTHMAVVTAAAALSPMEMSAAAPPVETALPRAEFKPETLVTALTPPLEAAVRAPEPLPSVRSAVVVPETLEPTDAAKFVRAPEAAPTAIGEARLEAAAQIDRAARDSLVRAQPVAIPPAPPLLASVELHVSHLLPAMSETRSALSNSALMEALEAAAPSAKESLAAQMRANPPLPEGGRIERIGVALPQAAEAVQPSPEKALTLVAQIPTPSEAKGALDAFGRRDVQAAQAAPTVTLRAPDAPIAEARMEASHANDVVENKGIPTAFVEPLTPRRPQLSDSAGGQAEDVMVGALKEAAGAGTRVLPVEERHLTTMTPQALPGGRATNVPLTAAQPMRAAAWAPPESAIATNVGPSSTVKSSATRDAEPKAAIAADVTPGPKPLPMETPGQATSELFAKILAHLPAQGTATMEMKAEEAALAPQPHALAAGMALRMEASPTAKDAMRPPMNDLSANSAFAENLGELKLPTESLVSAVKTLEAPPPAGDDRSNAVAKRSPVTPPPVQTISPLGANVEVALPNVAGAQAPAPEGGRRGDEPQPSSPLPRNADVPNALANITQSASGAPSADRLALLAAAPDIPALPVDTTRIELLKPRSDVAESRGLFDLSDMRKTEAPRLIERPSDLPAELRLPVEAAPVSDLYRHRTPEVRNDWAERMGGGADTERSVDLALKWLAAHQSADGRWDWREFDASCGKCGGVGSIDANRALTGLSLLCFLGAGHTHLTPGPYRDVIRKGLDWLAAGQTQEGDLRGGETLYSQGIAAIALGEAYGMTGDPILEVPVRRAVRFIVAAQNPKTGGWRYDPGQEGDTSVLGWQLMALKSASLSGIEVPNETWSGAKKWLESAAHPSMPGVSGYQPGTNYSPAMTAEAMFARQLLGTPRDALFMQAAARHIVQHLPNWQSEPNTYFWYYATLALFNHQGEAWLEWNSAMSKALTGEQKKRGPQAGSWDPVGEWADKGGRIYQTAICTLMLEVYYRYLPLYGRGDGPVKIEDPIGVIYGRVTHAATGEPLSQVAVRLDWSNEAPIIVPTDKEGRYQLPVPHMPDHFAVSASKEGFVPASRDMAASKLSDGFAELDFKLRPQHEDVIALEDEPGVHHVGNDRFEGRINSQFQRQSEGAAVELTFTLPAEWDRKGRSGAELRLMAKGVQCPTEIEVNGHLLDQPLDEAPEDGSFGEWTADFPARWLHGGENSVVIRTTACRGDLDDFEFVNVQVVLGR